MKKAPVKMKKQSMAKMAKKSPAKMAKKSPMKKPLIGKQANLPKELRDKNVRIIDIAFKYGFHSQEAFTKSFFNAFKINPGEYVKTKRPIPLVIKKDVLYPENLLKEGNIIMVKDEEIKVKLEEIPAHKLIYLERDNVTNYIDFWDLIDSEKG